MRKLQLTKSGLNKIKSHLKEIKVSDLEDSIRSLPPGEWCLLTSSAGETWVAFINPLMDERFAIGQVVARLSASEVADFDPAHFIEARIHAAHQRRARFKDYARGQRLFYGMSDGLPGLIIDQYLNASVIQINTAGVDRYRELIKNTVEKLTGTKAYFLDNHKYREKEFLPSYEVEAVPALEVEENGIHFHIRADVIQKVGFYYDHRENRHQLIQLLQRLNKTPKTGVDLFCYAGAWGLAALKAGVGQVDFVDQGDFAQELQSSLERNGWQGRGEFYRQDVFKYLDACINSQRKFDLILSDPPAFAKSPTQRAQALEGYSKLHRKVFKLAAEQAICVFSSCTHYIGHEEFQKNVLDAAHKEGKQIQLLYCGMQGWDHPVCSLDDRANYIKSYIYILE